MKIDVWSDIMCPFCYIGKRKLEAALNGFPGREKIEISWHSFQLDPSLKYQPGKDLYSYLSEKKGISKEHSLHLHDQLTQVAKENGLEYNFDKAIIANSFDAHRLIQLAKKHKLDDVAEERLFKAYFTEGKNISDPSTLITLGYEIGLDKDEVKNMLSGKEYADEVREDIEKADQLGIRGVPFFVLNNKYAVSGAQPVEVFARALNTSYTDWQKENPFIGLNENDEQVCSPGEDCN